MGCIKSDCLPGSDRFETEFRGVRNAISAFLPRCSSAEWASTSKNADIVGAVESTYDQRMTKTGEIEEDD